MDTLCTLEYRDRTIQIAVMEEEWPIAAIPGLDIETGPAPVGVTLAPITLSAPTIAPNDALTISAQAGGPDVTFIYLELLLRDPQAEQYYGPVYREPIAAPQTQRIGSVEVPDWSAAPVAQVTIKPFLRLLTDGKDWALGFVKPRTPKFAAAGLGYTLEALYRPAWGRTQHRAQVSFDQTGEAQNILVFRDIAGGEVPRSVNPRRGDRFTPLLRLYRPAGGAGSIRRKAVVQSNMLKWRSGIRWQPEPLIPGAYLIGLVAEDLDGQLHRRYTEMIVQGSAP